MNIISMGIKTNAIQEIYQGHYLVLLDFPTPHDLLKIIDNTYRYVWGVEHQVLGTEWKDYDFLLFDKKMDAFNVKARNMKMDFLMETGDFLKNIPDIHQSIQIIQTNHVPPYYLDLSRLEGKAKYDLLLQKVDYLFYLELPGAVDYAPLISPHIDFLERVISKFAGEA